MGNEQSFSMEPIAYLRTPWHEKFGVPRQPGLIAEAWGEVEFLGQFAAPEAREGLQGFSHLWITFLFHQVAESDTRLRVRPPRLGGNEKLGVFATRSPFRPNRLGLSVCQVESVFPVLRLRGVDIVDGTPILDIRPYVPYVDSVPEAESGFAMGPPQHISVAFAPELAERWNRLSLSDQKLLEGMISLQPAPAYQSDGSRVYHASVDKYEVAWRMREGVATVISLDGGKLEDEPGA